jgi:4a-hydroxytetrahydrobiopterin dehydratase
MNQLSVAYWLLEAHGQRKVFLIDLQRHGASLLCDIACEAARWLPCDIAARSFPLLVPCRGLEAVALCAIPHPLHEAAKDGAPNSCGGSRVHFERIGAKQKIDSAYWRAGMSDQGWRSFLVAEGVEDWVVLHGGATAVFRVASLREAAALAEAVAAAPGVEGSGVMLGLADNAVTVRLSRDLWQLEERHVELARAVSEVARARGAVADRAAVQEIQLAIAAKGEAIDVAFWRAVLGYVPMADDSAVDPLGHGSTVWMQELDEAKPLRHAMHVDVSVAREHVKARLAAALAAGGRIVDDSHAPSHWTLADRAGNRVCVCGWPDGSTRSSSDGGS